LKRRVIITGYFSLKDVNKKNGSKPILYYQIYSSANYKRNVKKRNPGRNREITYQNMSRNNIMICLGPYSSVMNEKYLKSITLEKAMKHFKEGKITEDDLKDIEYGFRLTEYDEVRIYEDFALIQFKRFIEIKEIQNQLYRMTDNEKRDAFRKELTHMEWAINAYKNHLRSTKEEISKELGFGPIKVINEYLRRMFIKYGEAFAEKNGELAKAAKVKIDKFK
jgi:hypothetical protein